MTGRPQEPNAIQRLARSAAGMTTLALAIGLSLGFGAFTFIYGRGASYLTNNPAACANCHVMQGHFNGWLQASHRSAATCNDCHTPPGLIGKYVTKASNGFWHSVAFTSGTFQEPIRIKAGNLVATERRCRTCHAEVASVVDGPDGAEARSCVPCHRSVGHRR